MSAFGSSAINKSGKKFAPKAPAQRRRHIAQSSQAGTPDEDTGHDLRSRPSTPPSTQPLDAPQLEVGHDHEELSANPVQRIDQDIDTFVSPDAEITATRDENETATQDTSLFTTSREQFTSPLLTPPPTQASQRPSKRRRLESTPEATNVGPITVQDTQPEDISRTEPSSITSPKKRRSVSHKESGETSEANLAVTKRVLRKRREIASKQTETIPELEEASLAATSLPDSIPSQDSATRQKSGGPRSQAAGRRKQSSVSKVPVSQPLRETLEDHTTRPDTRRSSRAKIAKRKRSPAVVPVASAQSEDEPQNSPHEQGHTMPNGEASRLTAQNTVTEAHDNASETNEARDEEEEDQLEEDGRKRKRRKNTPDGADLVEIDTSTTRMFDLCKNSKTGKKSKLEAEFQNIDWSQIAKARKEAEDRKRAGEISKENETIQADERPIDHVRPQGPQLKIVNGQITIDNSSLMVSTHQQSNQIDEEIGNAILETDLTKRINSRTWLNDTRRDPEERFQSSNKSQAWTEEETDRFYDALKMFGTDFFIISKMFPGRTRRHIKLKYVREERSDLDRVHSALGLESVPMNMEKYCEATGQEATEFMNPRDLEDELKADEERQKADIERTKQEQEEAQKQRQEAATAAKDNSKGGMSSKKGGSKRKRKRQAESDPEAA